ncbi:hypothetical protein H5410_028720 [Solanum commersonii]|uniref:NB-ARC domain-containing protein n=1 Tax=Solanum commersonii TaxID=4109 RepID=A0A9J5Z6Y5_SOLCO|nr:hypothetical protein H5410_028720 [Solanum commersonii]
MDLLNSNAYSVDFMKEEIVLVKEGLELIRSLDSCNRKDQAYQRRGTGDDSQKQGLIEINKSSSIGEIIVRFEEETEWLISKLTSGPAEVDVISIVGMSGLGKTTLAYRVFNDKSVVDYFNVRAWHTVDQ